MVPVAGYALTVAFSLSLQFLPPVIPVMKRTLSMTAGQAGTLMSSLALFGIVVSPLVGYLADRWGGRTVGLLGLACLIASEAWFACSTSYTSLLMARLAMGVGSATLSILGAQSSASTSPVRSTSAAMGTMNTAVPIGILISQLSFSRIAAARGWQAPVWICLVFTCVVATGYVLFYRDPELRHDEAPMSLVAGLRHLSPQIWMLGLVWLFWNAGALVVLTFANDTPRRPGCQHSQQGRWPAFSCSFRSSDQHSWGHVLVQSGGSAARGPGLSDVRRLWRSCWDWPPATL